MQKKVHTKNLLSLGDRDADLERRELWKDTALTAIGNGSTTEDASLEADRMLRDFDDRFTKQS